MDAKEESSATDTTRTTEHTTLRSLAPAGSPPLPKLAKVDVLAGTGSLRAQIVPGINVSLGISPDALHKVLREEGILVLRNMIPRDDVLAARKRILSIFSRFGFLDESQPMMDGVRSDILRKENGRSGPSLLKRPDIAKLPEIAGVLEHPRLSELFSKLFGVSDTGQVDTLEYKWLRAVQKGKFTGLHMDRVYFQDKRRFDRLLTAWIPIGDIPVEQGVLMWAPKSHKDDRFRAIREKMARLEIGSDGTESGWITSDPNTLTPSLGAIEWHTTPFCAGDVCIFGVELVHMSTTNTTECFRISCDTRWIPKE